MKRDTPAPQRQQSPLDHLLRSAAETTADPDVRGWLLAMLNTGERAEGRPPAGAEGGPRGEK
jgi:hypothetical protein